jgi:hypothetical protein
LLSLGNGVYQYNWAVPKSYANTCRLLKLSLGEGNGADGKPIVHSATFMFTR